MKKYVLSIDQGTTGSTALLLDIETKKLIGSHNTEFNQYFPEPGKVEHDLNEIWESVRVSIKEVLNKHSINKEQISSIGITNQRETTCAYTKKGKPLTRAIVWQDRRTHDLCLSLSASYHKNAFQKLTGLPLDPYFSGTKMKWLIENSKEVQDALDKNDLLLSTIDSFLLYKLTNCSSFKTEASNASRTSLMSLENCSWDQNLLSFFNIPLDTLPSIDNSFGDFGVTKNLDFLPDDIPINCILGDQQAALFGQSGINKGDLKCTYGTGAFILLNIGKEIKYSSNKLLTTVAFKHNNESFYALEGSTYIAGAAVQWLRDNLKLFTSSKDIESLALKSENKNTKDLTFLPFFTGIGSPYWNSKAKGALIGLTRGTTTEDISKVCLEGIALSVNDSIKALVDDCDFEVKSINVDGGASMNDLLLQLQANFSNMDIIRPEIIETTAYGVALGALIGSKQLKMEEVKSLWKKDIVVKTKPSSYFSQKLELWNLLINKIY